MERLSIEEKAKAYDEAIERAKNFIENGDERERTIAESIFAGIMEESEDERIRKELLEHCKNQAKPYIQTGNKCPQIQSWIDWLEKQGEQKLAWCEEDDYNLQCMIAKVASDIQKGNVGRNQELIDWLESLRHQNRWKPSDEHMQALDWALSLAKNCGEECAFDLRTLQDKLKKLMEE